VGKSWEDIKWDREGHRTCVNHELGTFYRLLYSGMVTVGGRRVAASFWTHWGLRQYVDQGTFQDVVAKMFWVSLVAKF
jgi:hypothetical protein